MEDGRKDNSDSLTIPPAARNESNPMPAVMLIWYGALAIGAAAVIVWLPELRMAGVLALAVVLALLPIALRQTAAKSQSRHDDRALIRGFEHLSKRLENMVQEGGLSEAAKRVLHRREERDLLTRAIEQDITDQDWEAAMVLVRELAERFGYRADAEEFRARIDHARAETLDRNVSEALTRLEALLEKRQWPEAYREAARIERLFPDSPRVENLRDHVDQARRGYKLDLERQFLHAAERDEVDRAMKLLKQLDEYLSEGEAEQLREVARGVVSKARENLGARFKLLIEDKEWAEAVRVGERLMKEFPNTRMAEEVRDMIDVLRTRAEQQTTTAR